MAMRGGAVSACCCYPFKREILNFLNGPVVTPVGYETAVACSSDSAACFLVTPAVPRRIRGHR